MQGEIPIVCDLDALSPHERARRLELAEKLRARVLSRREEESGIELELPSEAALQHETLELILLERRCCPFLELRLEFRPAGGSTYLHVSGPPGTKEFLVASGYLGDAGSTPARRPAWDSTG